MRLENLDLESISAFPLEQRMQIIENYLSERGSNSPLEKGYFLHIKNVRENYYLTPNVLIKSNKN